MMDPVGTSVTLLLLNLNADVSTTFAFQHNTPEADKVKVYDKYGQLAQSVYEATKYGLEHHADLKDFFFG